VRVFVVVAYEGHRKKGREDKHVKFLSCVVQSEFAAPQSCPRSVSVRDRRVKFCGDRNDVAAATLEHNEHSTSGRALRVYQRREPATIAARASEVGDKRAERGTSLGKYQFHSSTTCVTDAEVKAVHAPSSTRPRRAAAHIATTRQLARARAGENAAPLSCGQGRIDSNISITPAADTAAPSSLPTTRSSRGSIERASRARGARPSEAEQRCHHVHEIRSLDLRSKTI